MSKTLSPELQKQIEQEAKAAQHTYPGTDYGHGFNKGYDSGYKLTGEKYADKWQEAEQENERLKAMAEGWRPLLEDILREENLGFIDLNEMLTERIKRFLYGE